MKCEGKSEQAGKECCYCQLLMNGCDGHPDYCFDDYGGWVRISEIEENEVIKER